MTIHEFHGDVRNPADTRRFLDDCGVTLPPVESAGRWAAVWAAAAAVFVAAMFLLAVWAGSV